MTRTEALKTIAVASKLADQGGTLQAADCAQLFRGQPKRHTTASLRTVARWLEDDSGVPADELIESTWS